MSTGLWVGRESHGFCLPASTLECIEFKPSVRVYGRAKEEDNQSRVIWNYDWLIIPDGVSGEESATNTGDARDSGSIPGLGRSDGVESGNWLQYSCLESSTDRTAWRVIVHGVAKGWYKGLDWVCCGIGCKGPIWLLFNSYFGPNAIVSSKCCIVLETG